MLLLALLLFGVFLVFGEMAEAGIALLFIFLAVWLLSMVIGIILIIFYVAAMLAGVALAIMSLVLINRFIQKVNRRGYISLYVLALPVSAIVIALALAALTGSGFTTQEATHTQVSYWYFWTRDVVSYHEIPTVWKRIITGGFWVSLVILVAFAVEVLISPKTKIAELLPASTGNRPKHKRWIKHKH